MFKLSVLNYLSLMIYRCQCTCLKQALMEAWKSNDSNGFPQQIQRARCEAPRRMAQGWSSIPNIMEFMY
jgi:hypothetical protein